MKVLIWGATGMVGQGALQECLKDSQVTLVQTVGRTPTGIRNPKLKEIAQKDLFNYDNIKSQLAGFDACFFCLGTPSAGKSEEEYTHITYDLTMAAAKTLVELNPLMTFVYVSGQGADNTEKGSVMWARVRGKLENDLQKLPFKAVYILRPGFIQPLDGIKSKTKIYRVFYEVLSPILPILRKAFPNTVTTTRILGQTMLKLAKQGYSQKILSSKDFQALVSHDSKNSV